MLKDRRVVFLASFVAALVLLATALSTYALYRSAFRQGQERLLEIVTARATLLEAVARFDARENADYPGGAAAATLAQLRDASRQFSGFGETGEFTVARRGGDTIVFLERLRHAGPQPEMRVPYDSALAEPMKEALAGRSGTLVGRDYRGTRVMAAYAPVPTLGVGLVAKIDAAEVRRPVMVMGVGMGGVAVLLSLLGIGAVAWLGDTLGRETRKAEVEARRVARSLDLALESAGQGMFDREIRTGRVEVSDTFARLLGYAPGELRESFEAWKARLHSEDRDRALRAYEDHLAGRLDAYRVEVRQRRKDGSWVWILSMAKVVERDETGHPLRMVGTYTDVTPRREAERALRESEARLQAAQHMAGLGFLDWDLATGRIFLSEEALRLYEIDPGQPLTTPELIARRVHPDDLDTVQKGLDLATRGVRPFNMDHRVVLDDGRVLWVHAQAELIRDAEGHPSRLLGTVVDVTARKEAERVLEAHHEVLEAQVAARTTELAAANKELEAFTYSVSHDLKAPLRAIDAHSALLVERAGSLDREAAALVDKVRSQTRRMADLLDDLLALSRSGRQELRREPVDLDQLVRDAFRRERALAPDRAMALRLAELPRVMGDLSLLNQVVQNLVGNAVKFTGTRDRAVIEVACERTSGETVFHMRDNGVGFDMAHAEKLFQPFRRLHYEDEFPGTGVGLAIVQRIVERHGGRVWAEAEPDRGATVYFTLPLPEEAA